MTLPFELVSEIFLYLRSDADVLVVGFELSESKKTLDACSRVCHSWRACALSHLFHDVNYSFCCDFQDALERPREQAGRWGYYLSRRADCPRKTLLMFATFLETHPHIQPHLRCLRLNCWPSQWDDHVPYGRNDFPWSFNGVHDAVPARDFVRLLRSLPQLDELYLSDLIVLQEPPPSDLFINRISLRVLATTYFRLFDLSVVLGCFRSITDLWIEESSNALEQSTPRLPTLTLTPTCVRSLIISELGRPESVIPTIVLLCQPPDCLVISLPFPRIDTSFFVPVLAHAAPALQHVHLVLHEKFLGGVGPPLDFSECARLHTLSLGIAFLYLLDNDPQSEDTLDATIEYIALVLQSAPASLRHLTLNIGRPSYIWSRNRDLHILHDLRTHLAPLDAALVGLSRRNGLDEVRFQYFVDDAQEKLRSELASALPRITEEGRLAIEALDFDTSIEKRLYLQWPHALDRD